MTGTMHRPLELHGYGADPRGGCFAFAAGVAHVQDSPSSVAMPPSSRLLCWAHTGRGLSLAHGSAGVARSAYIAQAGFNAASDVISAVRLVYYTVAYAGPLRMS